MQPTGSTTTAAAAGLAPPSVVLELARGWRWRAPDVTATVAEYAARLAYDAGDRSTALLAEGWLAHGFVAVGRGVGVVPRAVAALAEATRAGDVPAIDRLRVALATVARSLDDRGTARALLAPVLRRTGAPPAVRADAYLEAVLCGDQRGIPGRGGELDNALRAFRQVDGEDAELGLAWADAALAGQRRALRQPAEAADHARSGLRRILGEQHHPARLRSVSPHLVAILAHELVAALLDLDDVDAAREVAGSVPDWDGQLGSLVPTARLRLTLAQRVDLPSGARDEALRAAEWVAGVVDRRDLPELEVECHSLVAEIRESGGELSEALAASRRAHAAYRTLTATVERALVLLVRAAGEGPRSDVGNAPAWALRSPRSGPMPQSAPTSQSGPTNGAGVGWLSRRAPEPTAPSVRHQGSVKPRTPSVDGPPDAGVSRDGLASAMEDPRPGTADGDRARSLPAGPVDQADGSSPSETTMPDVLSQPTGPGDTAPRDAHPDPGSWIAITGPAAMDGPGGSGALTAAAVSGLFHGQPPPAPPDDSIEAPPSVSVAELGVELLNLDPAAEHAPHVIVIDIVTPVPNVSAVRSIVLRAAIRIRDQLPRAATLYLLDGQAVTVVMSDTAPQVVTRWVRSVSTGLSLRWSELAPELPRARFRIDVRALDGDRSIAEQLFDLRPGLPDPTPAAAVPPAGPSDPPEAAASLPPRRARHLAGAARQGPTGMGTVANRIDAKPGSGGRRRRPDVGSVGRSDQNTADTRGSSGAGPAESGSSEPGSSEPGSSEPGSSEPGPYEPGSGYDTREPGDRSYPRGPDRGQNLISAPAAPPYDPAIGGSRAPSSSGMSAAGPGSVLGAAGPGSVLGAMPGAVGPVAGRLPGSSAPFGSSGPSLAGGAFPLGNPIHPTGAVHSRGVEPPTGAKHRTGLEYPTAVLLLPGASLDVTTPGLSAPEVEPGESDGNPTGARDCDPSDSAAHPDPDSGRGPATQRPISELSFAELLAGALAAYRES